MKAVHTFPGEIQGTWCGYVGGEYVQVAAAAGKLWKIGFPATTAVSALGTLADAHTEFFGFREKLYILNGTQYKVFDGYKLSDVTGYVPTVLVASVRTAAARSWSKSTSCPANENTALLRTESPRCMCARKAERCL